MTPLQTVPILVAAGLGTSGKDLFAYTMPATAAVGIVVMPDRIGTPIDWTLPGWKRGSFQIIARSRQPQEAQSLAVRAATALTWMRPRQVAATPNEPALLVRFCLPRHEPILYPRGDNALWEASINLDFAAATL